MSHSTKTYPFSLNADRFIREGLITTTSAPTAGGTTATLTSLKTLSVGQSVVFLNPTTHALVAGPVTITNINPSTNVITVNATITVSSGDIVAKELTARAQMVLGIHIVNGNPEMALVTLTSIDGTVTHGYFAAAPNSTYSNEVEWLALGGIKIAAVTGVTTPADVKITVFAKNLG